MKNSFLFNIEIENFSIDFKNIIIDCINETLLYEKIFIPFEVSISIVSEDTIKNLNYKYRNKNNVTDVLSFPLINKFDNIKFNKNFLNPLGDIIICFDKALQQSKNYNHTINREIAFLTVHSTLHLLGYNHLNKEDEIIMINKQKKILNKLNMNRNE